MRHKVKSEDSDFECKHVKANIFFQKQEEEELATSLHLPAQHSVQLQLAEAGGQLGCSGFLTNVTNAGMRIPEPEPFLARDKGFFHRKWQ